MSVLRLRQLVIACGSQDSYDQLRDLLGLGAPFHDSGVAEFGLHNAVFAIGDQFLEIVVPVADTAPAKRFIERSGEGGYMAIFQTDDIAAARQRLADQDIRSVWNIDLDDIMATHLHPADIGGAIVSLDQPKPPESWRWAGKGWESRSVPGRLVGAEFTSPEPGLLAEKWTMALGLRADHDQHTHVLALQSGPLRFVPGNAEKLRSFHLAVPEPALIWDRAREQGLPVVDKAIEFAGVHFTLEPLKA